MSAGAAFIFCLLFHSCEPCDTSRQVPDLSARGCSGHTAPRLLCRDSPGCIPGRLAPSLASSPTSWLLPRGRQGSRLCAQPCGGVSLPPLPAGPARALPRSTGVLSVGFGCVPARGSLALCPPPTSVNLPAVQSCSEIKRLPGSSI